MAPPEVTLLYASAAVVTALGGYAWRNRDVPGALPFVAMMATIAVWSLGYAVALGTFDLAERLFWRNVQWLGIAFVPAAWLVFALEYAGYGELVDRRTVAALAVVPLATVAVAWTRPSLLWQNSRIDPSGGLAIVTREFAAWYWVNLAYAYGAFVTGTLVLFSLARARTTLYTTQVASLVVGATVAWLGNVVSTFRLGPVPMDYTPFAFTLTAVLFAHALFRYRLLESVPASLRTGRAAVIREMDDGVAVLDRDGRIVDLNPVGAEVLDAGPADPLGEPFEDVAAPSLDAVLDGETTTLTTADGRRRFEVRATETTGPRGSRTGWILVFRDVTVRRAYEERLTVVNRILRHNVRNDMTVVIGNAEHVVANAGSEEVRTAGEQIRSTARGTADIAEKAQRIESLHEADAERERVDLSALVADAAERVSESGATLERDVEAGLAVLAVPEVDRAVEVVVDNAVEHNDADEPRVRVAARRDDDAAVVTVADNGPGIPDHERAVLTRGRETPLEHGSGLGLWLAQWAVRASGGSLSFEVNEPRGSVVEIRLPAA